MNKVPVSKYFNEYVQLVLVIVLTVIFTYFTPGYLAVAWYVVLLVLYYRSTDEAFWLVVFLATTDGFMSFMGLYEVVIPLFPGLPSIELVQFYILLTAVKATRAGSVPVIFINKFLTLLGIYLIFMVIWGQMLGFTEGVNGYFRLLKLTLPLLLFYSMPRLLRSMATYERLFRFIFILLVTAFITQLFTLLTGYSPAGLLNINIEQVAEPREFRGFYNGAASLCGLFGALFYLGYRKKSKLSPVYMYILIFSAFGMALLSATRGWIIGFGVIILLTLAFTGVKISRVGGFLIIILILSYLGWSNAKIREQVIFSHYRLSALGSLTEEDKSAGGTLKRLDVRAPKVMGVWKENPVFGWGFSDVSRHYSDGHVANQNLLMTSGIVGVFLLVCFFMFFSIKMIERYIYLPPTNPLKRVPVVTVIFLWGWFIIHSTSGQHFSYGGIPQQIVPQAVFFSFASLIYNETYRFSGRTKVD